MLYLFEQFGDVLIIKWERATEKGVEDDAARPHVDLRPRIGSARGVRQQSGVGQR